MYSDSQLNGMLKQARQMETVSWQLEVIALGLLAKRDPAKRGRGNVDIGRRGIKAMVAQKAIELECSEGTIWSSIRIFRTFFENGETNLTILTEKGFYLKALEADDPRHAIRSFVRLRERLGSQFTVADADRWVQRRVEKLRRRQRCGTTSRSHLAENLEETLGLLRRQRLKCPDLRVAMKFYDNLIDDVQDYLADVVNRVAESRLARIFKESNGMVLSDHELAEKTGLSIGNVRFMMRQLENERMVFRPNEERLAWRTVLRVSDVELDSPITESI